MSELQLLPTDAVIDVPADVAVCPYCQAPLSITFTAWEQQEDGSWAADELSCDCTTEPDIDTAEWPAWMKQHTYMPYVYMLPVHIKVRAWVYTRYRFDCGGSEPDPRPENPWMYGEIG